MVKTLLFCLLLVATQAVPQGLAIDKDLNEEWEAYKIQYEKQYDSLTELSRRMIWEDNLKYIQQHNLEYDLGKHTYTLGLNEFTDMTNKEFKAKYLGIKKIEKKSSGSLFVVPENIGALPTTVDWRTKGYVTPVKFQGQCGSCWAFSTTGSLEGQHFRKTGNLISFSEQQLIDCSYAFGNNACHGGWMDWAFQYIQKYGIESEADYPYKYSLFNCNYHKKKVVATVTGYVDIPYGNESSLASAVATVGPISVGIDANHKKFFMYKSGIYNEKDCSTYDLDHAVLAVGYGVENGKNYWLVKNSWGTSWGISGYIKMSKDANNQCGIATNASFPLV